MSAATAARTWPVFDRPEHVEQIETVPLAERDLPATTLAALQRAAEQWPERTAITVLPDAARWREPRALTYADLLDATAKVAAALAGRGVTPTTPVAIVSPNCLDLVAATLGAQTAGIAAPLNGGLGSQHLRTLLQRLSARHAIVASPQLAPAVWASVADLAAGGDLDHLLVLDPTDGLRADLPAIDGVVVEYLADAMAGEEAGFRDVHGPADIAAVFHTGGTTGLPKLAAHTHANQVADAWMIAADSTAIVDDAQPGTVLAALPLFHVNALHVTVLAPLLRGQHVLWAGPLGFRDPTLYTEIWRIVEHYRVTAVSAVPTVYAVLAGCPVDADISSLRFAVVGASALPPATREVFEGATGVPLLEGYGLTEATCATARSFVSHPRAGSVGKRLPYQGLRVVREDPNGAWTDVEEGAVGTLLVGGPTVFAGYVVGRDDDGFVLDDLGKIRDGWLDTGDLARVEDGFIHLAGRAKDLIIRGGHNIEPAAVEEALRAHPDVVDAAAVGRPDRRAGEVPVAFVTVVAGSTVTEDDLVAFAAGSDLEAAARPKAVTVVPALPVTDLGKPAKLPLRAIAAATAIEAEVRGLDGVSAVEGVVEDGGVRVDVHVGEGVDRAAIEARLAGYVIATRLVPR